MDIFLPTYEIFSKFFSQILFTLGNVFLCVRLVCLVAGCITNIIDIRQWRQTTHFVIWSFSSSVL